MLFLARATLSHSAVQCRPLALLPRATGQGFISQYLAYNTYSSKFYSLSHNLLHVVAASWMASHLADHVCAWWRPSRLPALRVARLIHDPAITVCLGVLMVGHQHDTTDIGEFFHDCWGTAFIVMGLLHFVSTAVHATHAQHARLSMLARALHAYAWTFNGLWACLMGLWMNLWGDKQDNPRFRHRWTGTREILWPAIGQQLPSGYEEGMALVAFTLWITGLLTALDVAFTDPLSSNSEHRATPGPAATHTHPTLSHTIEELPLVGSDQGGTHEDEAISAKTKCPSHRLVRSNDTPRLTG